MSRDDIFDEFMKLCGKDPLAFLDYGVFNTYYSDLDDDRYAESMRCVIASYSLMPSLDPFDRIELTEGILMFLDDYEVIQDLDKTLELNMRDLEIVTVEAPYLEVGIKAAYAFKTMEENKKKNKPKTKTKDQDKDNDNKDKR